MPSREQALDRIASLAREHALTAADIEARLAESAEAAPAERTPAEPAETAPAKPAEGGVGEPAAAARTKRSNLLGRILGYLGGIFVFAGLGVFISLNWEAMNAGARIIVSLGSGLAALIMGLVAASDARYARAATPLYLIAAALEPTGLLVAIDEFSSGGDWRYAVLITSGIMAAQQGAIFRRQRRTTLLFTTVAFALWFLGTAMDLLDVDLDVTALLLGLSTVSLALGLEKTPHKEIAPFWYFVGAVGAYGGLFAIVEGTPIELAFLLVACGGLLLSVFVRSRTLLIVTTIAILGFVTYFTSQHFLDSLGWPVALVVLGIVLLLLSAMALRIDRRYLAR